MVWLQKICSTPSPHSYSTPKFYGPKCETPPATPSFPGVLNIMRKGLKWHHDLDCLQVFLLLHLATILYEYVLHMFLCVCVFICFCFEISAYDWCCCILHCPTLRTSPESRQTHFENQVSIVGKQKEKVVDLESDTFQVCLHLWNNIQWFVSKFTT